MATSDTTPLDNAHVSRPDAAGHPDTAEHRDLDEGLVVRREEGLGITPRQFAIWLIAGLVIIGGIALFQGNIPLPFTASSQVSTISTGVTGGGPVPQIGEPAPDFTLFDTNARQVRLSELRGKPVVMNFWATWCPPCRAEMPDLQAVHREYGDRVVILSVNLMEDPALVVDYMTRLNLTFSSVLDVNGEVTNQYRVVALPTTYFIGPDGKIFDRNIGAVTKGLIESKLRKVLG